MKKLISLIPALLAVILICSCAKDEENLSGTIAGLVTDYTNANTPIAGATVTLGTKGLTKTTGNDGRFEFSNIEPGTYTIQVSANRFQTTTKQVTVYAGQTATCDFQLSVGAQDVDITPITLNFGNTAEQLSFTITNNSNGALNYTISNIPDFVKVSPTTGAVSARGKQAITVSVINRASITSHRNGQLTINIGNDSYTVSLNVEPYQEEVISVDINPQALSFDKDTEQLKFMMTSNYSKSLDYTISNNLDILTVSPESGTLTPRGKAEISVSVKDRKNIKTNRTGVLTIQMGGNTYVVNVSVAKYEEGGTQPVDTEVKNGLFAYFTFENSTKDVTEQELNSTGIGTSFVDSYNGTKALNIPAKSSSMLSIPNPLVDQYEMSISFWAKDLQDGHVFHAVRSYDNKSAFLLAVENGRLKYVVTRYHVGYKYDSSPSFTNGSLSGWHMITLVSDFNKTSYGTITTRLYIDGDLMDVVTEDDNPAAERGTGNSKNYNACTKFVMGGELNESYAPQLSASKLVIDNLRIYRSRMLSEDEVKTIYNAEK